MLLFRSEIEAFGPDLGWCSYLRSKMYKRFLATTIISVALLLSQDGNFLVAAFCPHLESATASCNTQPAEQKMSHEHMGHAGMGGMEHERKAQPNPNAVALSQSSLPCLHCASHSGATSSAITLKEGDATRRYDQISNPHTVSIAATIASSVPLPNFRAHGPPGKTTPRHVLIHVFRI